MIWKCGMMDATSMDNGFSITDGHAYVPFSIPEHLIFSVIRLAFHSDGRHPCALSDNQRKMSRTSITVISVI